MGPVRKSTYLTVGAIVAVAMFIAAIDYATVPGTQSPRAQYPYFQCRQDLSNGIIVRALPDSYSSPEWALNGSHGVAGVQVHGISGAYCEGKDIVTAQFSGVTDLDGYVRFPQSAGAHYNITFSYHGVNYTNPGFGYTAPIYPGKTTLYEVMVPSGSSFLPTILEP